MKSEDKENGESDERVNKILVFKFTSCEQWDYVYATLL